MNDRERIFAVVIYTFSASDYCAWIASNLACVLSRLLFDL